MTAVMAKFFLKEKLTLAHFSAIIFTAVGIVLISKPEFIFHRNKEAESRNAHELMGKCRNLSNNQAESTECIEKLEYEQRMMHFKQMLGIGFTILSAFLTSSTHLLIKKLNKSKVHWAVNTASVSWFGLPLSIVLSIVLVKLQYGHVNFEQEKKDLPMDLFYSIIASMLSNLGQVLLNMALQHEEAIKIAITRTVDVFFAFAIQFLLLGIIPDYLSVTGAMLIITGTFFILIFKILEFKYDNFKLKQSIKYANYILVQPGNAEIFNKKKTIRDNLLKSFFFEF
jgi:drug/metabolite transporter (DMT)-like permease